MSILTLAQLKALFCGVTVSITGLDAKFVRNAYHPDGQPAFEKAQNVVFINLGLVDDSYDKQRDIVIKPNDAISVEQRIGYTEVLQVNWTLYGPDSFDLARTLKNGLLMESARSVLRASKVYPLTNMPNPTRGPSEFNAQWWERSDLQARFNIATERTVAIPSLAGAVIQVVDPAGVQRVINIE